MLAAVPEDWPQWPEQDLEFLGHCPACGSEHRELLYADLIDRWFHADGRWRMYQCRGCASAYIDPRPNAASIHRAYRHYETHRPVAEPRNEARLAVRLRNGYLNTRYGYRLQPASAWGYVALQLLPPPLRQEWDHYARHLDAPTPGHNRLLDVGCGNGEFLARARQQGWEVHGIDLDEAALQHARAAGIEVTRGPTTPEAFPAESFDAITSHQVIEHVHDPRTFVESLYTWLKPGGRVWLGTPNNDSTLHRQFGADWCDLHPPQHLVLLAPNALRTMLSSAGFVGTRLLPRGYLDSHFYSQSRELRDSPDVGDWTSLNTSDARSTPWLTRVVLETRAWFKPDTGSDLVMVAWKPAR